MTTFAPTTDPQFTVCPTCQAGPGATCRTPLGRLAAMHLTRKQAAAGMPVRVPSPRQLGLRGSVWCVGEPLAYRVVSKIAVPAEEGGGTMVAVVVAAGGVTLRRTIRLGRGCCTERGLRLAVEAAVGEELAS